MDVVLFGRGISDVKFAISFLNRRYGMNWTQDTVREGEREEREVELARRLRAEAEAFARPQDPANRNPYKIDPDRLYTTADVANAFDVPTTQIYGWIRQGWVKCKRLGKSNRILGSDLVDFIDREKTKIEEKAVEARKNEKETQAQVLRNQKRQSEDRP